NPINAGDPGEIKRAVEAFARSPNGGLVVTAGAAAAVHRELIITLAAQHKLPTVYYERFFVAAGGLISYGANFVDLCLLKIISGRSNDAIRTELAL
ncbi:MAG: hypothetical protein WCF53_08765, partial [Pseudolabrys sp.]